MSVSVTGPSSLFCLSFIDLSSTQSTKSRETHPASHVHRIGSDNNDEDFFMRATLSVMSGAPTSQANSDPKGSPVCPRVGTSGWRPWPVGNVSTSRRLRFETEACWLGRSFFFNGDI